MNNKNYKNKKHQTNKQNASVQQIKLDKKNTGSKLNEMLAGRKMLLILAFVITTITSITYYPMFKNEITNWDDDKYIVENPYLQKLDGNTIKQIFSDYYMGNYHPLSMLSLSIDYKIGGKDKDGKIKPWIYHSTNLILHIISSLLVFFFVYVLFRNITVAAVAGILFGVHTLHVESIVWISERKDVLYTAFFVASLLFYTYFAKNGKIIYYILAFVLFILSLLSKGQAVSLAVTLIAIDYFLDRKLLSMRVILEKIPFFILAVIFGIIAIKAQKAGEAMQDIQDYEFYKRIGFAGYGFAMYLIKLVLPLNLSAIYPYPDILNRSIPVHYWAFMIPTLLSIIAFFYYYKRSKQITFSIAFFIINIVLLLQLIAVGSAIYADRYAYIPSIGFFILIGWITFLLIKKYSSMRVVILSIVGIYSIVLIFFTWDRIKVWKDSATLWDDVVKKQPKAVVAWNNRGSIKDKEGRHAEAIEDFTRAIEYKPDYTHAFYNRGTAKKDLGNERNDIEMLKSALADFDKSLQIKPEFAEAYHNRGITKDLLGDFNGAIKDFDLSISINPKDPNPMVNRGVAKGKLGKLKEAIEDFTQVITTHPEFPSAYSNRGLARDMMGDTKGAIQDYDIAISLDKKSETPAYTNRGIAKKKLKDYQGAINDFSVAIERKPKAADAYYFRAMTKIDLGDIQGACNDFSISMQLGNNFAAQQYKVYCGKK